jgi:hypothetical protein
MPGVVLELRHVTKTKNPIALGSWRASFAIPDGGREVSFGLNNIETRRVEGEDVPEGKVVVRLSHDSPRDVLEAFDKARVEGRETRQMITGNILGGFDIAKGHGQIVNYTTAEGETKAGIFMPRSFNRDTFLAGRPVRLPTASTVMQFLNRSAEGKVKSTNEHIIVVRMAPNEYRQGFA